MMLSPDNHGGGLLDLLRGLFAVCAAKFRASAVAGSEHLLKSMVGPCYTLVGVSCVPHAISHATARGPTPACRNAGGSAGAAALWRQQARSGLWARWVPQNYQKRCIHVWLTDMAVWLTG